MNQAGIQAEDGAGVVSAWPVVYRQLLSGAIPLFAADMELEFHKVHRFLAAFSHVGDTIAHYIDQDQPTQDKARLRSILEEFKPLSTVLVVVSLERQTPIVTAEAFNFWRKVVQSPSQMAALANVSMTHNFAQSVLSHCLPTHPGMPIYYLFDTYLDEWLSIPEINDGLQQGGFLQRLVDPATYCSAETRWKIVARLVRRPDWKRLLVDQQTLQHFAEMETFEEPVYCPFTILQAYLSIWLVVRSDPDCIPFYGSEMRDREVTGVANWLKKMTTTTDANELLVPPPYLPEGYAEYVSALGDRSESPEYVVHDPSAVGARTSVFDYFVALTERPVWGFETAL